MTKIYGHYGLTGKVGKLDLEEQLEFVSDSNDVLMERIVSSKKLLISYSCYKIVNIFIFHRTILWMKLQG